VDEWWATTTDLAPTTRVRDESVLRHHVLPAFGALALADVGQLDVRSWVADLVASGLAPTTVHKAYQVLSKAMTAAVDAGMLALSPCRNVSLPKVELREMISAIPRWRSGSPRGRTPSRSPPGPGTRGSRSSSTATDTSSLGTRSK
jgi:hypothetical protein